MKNAKLTIAKKIVSTLRKAGYEAYFVGGCVRDRVMRIAPKDYDIATDARAGQVMAIFRRTVPVGAKFGVVIVVENGENFEVATFRKDGEYLDSRHPVTVHFSDAKEDVLRRDFTINGLLYDPVKRKVIDHVGGVADIRRKIIRTIGDPYKRFSEDKLRLIRAVRFSARFKFKIEKGTMAALRELAPKITDVSAERIRDELVKILTGANPGYGLDLLRQTGLLDAVLPEITKMVGVQQPPEFHPEGDVYTHTKLMFDLAKKDLSPELAFAILLHDVGKPDTFRVAERIRFDRHTTVGARMADRIMRRLRFSNGQREAVVTAVFNHLKFMDVKKMRVNRLKRFLQEPTFPMELALHRLDCLASHRMLDNWRFCARKLKSYSKEELRPKPLISGNDLIRLGFVPGPLFKKILTAVEDEQLENRVSTRDEAVSFVEKKFAGLQETGGR
ncbi:MAG TPA: CCA tRNA nucleotidyltransferase [bacterium]|nr:CCA tRNA nucleotidyltransferase [bacterium]